MSSKGPQTIKYSYATVEAALGAVFVVDEAGQRGWLRGRIQHLRRLRLLAAAPGKGKTISYTLEDIDKMLIVLELEHFRVDPVSAVELVKRSWIRADGELTSDEAFSRGRASLGDLMLQARASSRDEDDVIITVDFSDVLTKLPRMGYTGMQGLHHSLGPWLRGKPEHPSAFNPPNRASIFNLSARLRALDWALARPKPSRRRLRPEARAIIDAAKRLP